MGIHNTGDVSGSTGWVLHAERIKVAEWKGANMADLNKHPGKGYMGTRIFGPAQRSTTTAANTKREGVTISFEKEKEGVERTCKTSS
jgi:hypothetical protein